MSHPKPYSCLKVSLLCILLLFLQHSYAQHDFSKVDQLLVQYQKQLGNNVVAMLYKDGKVVYQKALSQEFTPATSSPIAYSSQWLTAALVMTFVEEGKLSLDDKVGRYIPLFNDYSKGYITIRHCLQHLTGIASDKTVSYPGGARRNKYATLEEEVTEFASKKDIETNTGTAFSFSSTGPNIAGRILEIIAKKPFDRLMQERIFRPLGMKNSSFASDKAVNPSGGAVSSASNYLNFLAMLLQKGVWNGKQILSEASVTAMQTAYIDSKIIKYTPPTTEGFNYGYGQWIQETDEQGKALVSGCPSLFGTWPVIDHQRGYAFILFVKPLAGEQKRESYLQLKKEIDAALQ